MERKPKLRLKKKGEMLSLQSKLLPTLLLKKTSKTPLSAPNETSPKLSTGMTSKRRHKNGKGLMTCATSHPPSQLGSSSLSSATEMCVPSRGATSKPEMTNDATNPVETTIATTSAPTTIVVTLTATKPIDKTTNQGMITSKINPATTKGTPGADAECSNWAKHV